MDRPIWESTAVARTNAQVIADQQQAQPPPAQRQEIIVPAWQVREGLQRATAEMSHPALHSLRSGVADPDGTPTASERMEARAHNHKIEKTRQRIREGGGHDRDAEVTLAALLFPDGIGKVAHGPEHY